MNNNNLQTIDNFPRYVAMVYLLRKYRNDFTSLDELTDKLDNFNPTASQRADIGADIAEVFNSPNCDPISSSTIGRYFGQITGTSKGVPVGVKQEMIMKYILQQRYNYLSCVFPDKWENVERDILNEYWHKKQGIQNSMAVSCSDEDYGSHLGCILGRDIAIGQRLKVSYGTHGKYFLFRKIACGSEEDVSERFIVEEGDSTQLQVGDAITIPSIIVKVNIIGYDVTRKLMPVKRLYRSGGLVTKIEYVL